MPFEPIENYGVIGNMQSDRARWYEGLYVDFLCQPSSFFNYFCRRVSSTKV